MSRLPIARLVAAALLLHDTAVQAEPIEVDLAGALDRAHRAAPAAIAARGDVDVARAAAIGAAVTFTENPELEGGAGPRLTAARPIDGEVRIEQALEPWRREPRRRVARAGVARAQAEVGAALRDLDLEVSAAFYDALFAERAAELAQRGEDFAVRAADAADRRRKAGEITDLDANLARTALGRARAATHAAHGERTAALGRLGALIGAAPDDAIAIRGELRPLPVPDHTTAATRADLVTLDAERALADAELDQAAASGKPQLSLWAAYQREDTDSIVLGGLRMTLPIWNRAQGDQAAARAKQRRATELRAATLRAAERELTDALAAYTGARDAVAALERDVVPILDESEQLLDRTIGAGQLAISDYLVARREILDGRREYLERLLALAKAAATVRFVAGGAP